MFTLRHRGDIGKSAALQSGISLVELVLFIVVVSVGIAGTLLVLNTTTRNSADPLVRKQALAIAEAILEEVQLMPFTFCDPDDANAEAASAGTDCTADQNKGGGALTGPTPSTETRYSSANSFDNVADYGGFAMTGGAIYDINGGGTTAISGLSGYKLQAITITRVTTLPNVPANGAAVLISVTVTDPSGQNLVLEGIRTRYAPNTLP